MIYMRDIRVDFIELDVMGIDQQSPRTFNVLHMKTSELLEEGYSVNVIFLERYEPTYIHNKPESAGKNSALKVIRSITDKDSINKEKLGVVIAMPRYYGDILNMVTDNIRTYLNTIKKEVDNKLGLDIKTFY